MKKLASAFLALVLAGCISVAAMAAGINLSVFQQAKGFDVETDDIAGKTIVDPANIYDYRVSTGNFWETLYLYPSVIYTPLGELYFRIVGEYTASDWAFFNTLTIRVNHVSYTFTDVDSKRQVFSYGDIYEGTVSVLSNDSIACIQAIKEHRYEPIKARLQGSRRTVDFELPQKTIDVLVEMYDLYCAAGGLNQTLVSKGNTMLITNMEPTVQDKENVYISVYNYDYYKANHPDLAALYGDDREAYLNHFITTGMNEGRQGCKDFNLDAYKANNQDLVVAFGDNNAQYYKHFMSSGRAEGRKAV